MSLTTTQPSTSLFFLWLPDCTDPDAARRRFEATPQHLRQMMANVVAKKRDDYGGVTTVYSTSVHPRKAAEDHVIDGSIVVLEAESLDAVRNLIENDVFYIKNVWDRNRMIIKPFIPTNPVFRAKKARL